MCITKRHRDSTAAFIRLSRHPIGTTVALALLGAHTPAFTCLCSFYFLLLGPWCRRCVAAVAYTWLPTRRAQQPFGTGGAVISVGCIRVRRTRRTQHTNMARAVIESYPRRQMHRLRGLIRRKSKSVARRLWISRRTLAVIRMGMRRRTRRPVGVRRNTWRVQTRDA